MYMRIWVKKYNDEPAQFIFRLHVRIIQNGNFMRTTCSGSGNGSDPFKIMAARIVFVITSIFKTQVYQV